LAFFPPGAPWLEVTRHAFSFSNILCCFILGWRRTHHRIHFVNTTGIVPVFFSLLSRRRNLVARENSPPNRPKFPHAYSTSRCLYPLFSTLIAPLSVNSGDAPQVLRPKSCSYRSINRSSFGPACPDGALPLWSHFRSN